MRSLVPSDILRGSIVGGVLLQTCFIAVILRAQGTVNLVQNGSFEVITVVPGVETRARPWQGELSYNEGWSNAPDGGNYAHIGTVFQDVSTAPGQAYDLTFWAAADLFVSDTGTVVVRWGGADAAVVTTDPHSYDTGRNRYEQIVWQQFKVSPLVATTSLTRLELRATNSLILLDDVRLQVPPAVSYLVRGMSDTIDRQTGLFFQQVVVTNISTNILTGLRISVTNLPAGVQLLSATSTNPVSGAPFVEFTNSLAAGQTVTLTLAYYSATREAPVGVGVSVEAVTPIASVPSTGETVTIRRAFFRPDGYVAVEFDSLSSRQYAIQYSTDLSLWAQAQPVVPGNGGRMIWVDTGPPGTDSLPSTNRFYRIVLLLE